MTTRKPITSSKTIMFHHRVFSRLADLCEERDISLHEAVNIAAASFLNLNYDNKLGIDTVHTQKVDNVVYAEEPSETKNVHTLSDKDKDTEKNVHTLNSDSSTEKNVHTLSDKDINNDTEKNVHTLNSDQDEEPDFSQKRMFDDVNFD